MGEILGYPCYKDFEDLDRSQTTYTISINALLHGGQKIEIFVNICKDTVSEIFDKINKEANLVFSKEEYISLFGEQVTFELKINENPSRNRIIDKLINSEVITPDDIKEILNIMYNFGFNDMLCNEIIENIQYTNPIHKGILISLLINSINNTVSPFYPLQFREEQGLVNKITKDWSIQILETLMKTKLN
jgi:hypothetical protein